MVVKTAFKTSVTDVPGRGEIRRQTVRRSSDENGCFVFLQRCRPGTDVVTLSFSLLSDASAN
jgi:hypothetical protein